MAKLGVCYYPEHWPQSRWQEDAAAMADMGITYVRIGEFAWSRLESSPGNYSWDWLDTAIATLGDAGLEVVLGTPTATPPRWLIKQHPEILALDAEGRPRKFGSRRHYCFSSELYRNLACRFVEQMARRYGENPYVVAWQTDNEYGCHDTTISYSDAATEAFRLWLAQRYGAIEDLNQAWGTVFWSQEYDDFDDIDPPNLTVTEANPAHQLDFRRFSSDQVVAFNRAQVEILRQHAPGRDILHNFMGFETSFDHFDVSVDLDVASWDSYPLGFLDQGWFDKDTKARFQRQGHPDFAAFHHDLYRACGDGRFWVMEQQPGPVNWAPHNPAPLNGMLRLWAWECFAHGGEVTSFFRWRQAPFAQEQMHAGLLRPDGSPDTGAGEVAQIAMELKSLELPETTRGDIALMLDYDAIWNLEIQPQGREFSFLRWAFDIYQSLRERGLDVDIVAPHHILDGYKALILPCQPHVSEALAERLGTFKGKALIGPRSGSKTRDFSIPDHLAPGPLRDLLGLSVVRVESLAPGRVEAVQIGDTQYDAVLWREHLETDNPVLGRFTGDFHSGSPALVQNENLRYLACLASKPLLDKIIMDFCEWSEIEMVPTLNEVRIRRRGELQFAFNYGAGPAEAPAPAGAEFLLGSRTLPAAGVAAWTLR